MTFGNKIKKILKDNGYHYKVRVYSLKDNVVNRQGKKVVQEYDKVIIYSGRKVEVFAQRRSRRLIAWKNTAGEWEGDLETLRKFGDKKGNALYIKEYHDKVEPIRKVLFSDLWEESEKEFGKGSQEKELIKTMEDWRFQEMELAKIQEDEDKALLQEADEGRIQGNLANKIY